MGLTVYEIPPMGVMNSYAVISPSSYFLFFNVKVIARWKSNLKDYFCHLNVVSQSISAAVKLQEWTEMKSNSLKLLRIRGLGFKNASV